MKLKHFVILKKCAKFRLNVSVNSVILIRIFPVHFIISFEGIFIKFFVRLKPAFSFRKLAIHYLNPFFSISNKSQIIQWYR